MQYEVEGARPRDIPKKNLDRDCAKTLQKDCQAHKLNREDAMDHKQIRDD